MAVSIREPNRCIAPKLDLTDDAALAPRTRRHQQALGRRPLHFFTLSCCGWAKRMLRARLQRDGASLMRTAGAPHRQGATPSARAAFIDLSSGNVLAGMACCSWREPARCRRPGCYGANPLVRQTSMVISRSRRFHCPATSTTASNASGRHLKRCATATQAPTTADATPSTLSAVHHPGPNWPTHRTAQEPT